MACCLLGNKPLPEPMMTYCQLHQPWLWFITGGYLVKRWFLPAAARARGQSNDLNREILASNLFNCCKEVINAPPVPSISRCIHIVYRHKNVSEYQWSNFIYNCMSTFLHYVHCKDTLLDCSAPGGERCESLTRVDVIRLLRTHFTEILIKMKNISFDKMDLKMFSWKSWPFCSSPNVSHPGFSLRCFTENFTSINIALVTWLNHIFFIGQNTSHISHDIHLLVQHFYSYSIKVQSSITKLCSI